MRFQRYKRLYTNQFYPRNSPAKMAAASSSEQVFVVLGSLYFASVVMFIIFELWQRLVTTRLNRIDLPPVEVLTGHATPPPPYQVSHDTQDAAHAGHDSPPGLSLQDIR